MVNEASGFFFPQKAVVSANLTDFDIMNMKKDMDCKSGDFYYPFELDLFSIPTYGQEYKINSNKPIQFSIVLPSGKMSLKKYKGSDSEDINTFSVNAGDGFTGFIQKIEVEFKREKISMTQQLCAQEIVYAADVGFLSFKSADAENYQAVLTSQYMHAGEEIKVTIYNPEGFDAFPNEKNDKIELYIASESDGQYLHIQTNSQGLNVDLPNMGKSFLPREEQNPTASWLRAFPDEIEIHSPVGNLKLGNDSPISLGGVTKINDENLVFKSTPFLPDSYAVFGKIEFAEYEISGATTGLLLNDEQIVKSSWAKLPNYIQSALFGLLLTVVGSLWKFRDSIKSHIKMIIPGFKAEELQEPEKGSFICITDSGMIIAGQLIRKPGKNYSFYLIKNARRKINPSAKWEKEIIPEIKVRADAVEQSYVE
jgi:hypothetical protein